LISKLSKRKTPPFGLEKIPLRKRLGIRSPTPTLAHLHKWGFAHLCEAVATFSGYSKDPSRPKERER